MPSIDKFDAVHATWFRWLREGKFTMPAAIGHGTREAFARKKWDAHQAGKADERLFLWGWWVLGRWLGPRCSGACR